MENFGIFLFKLEYLFNMFFLIRFLTFLCILSAKCALANIG